MEAATAQATQVTWDALALVILNSSRRGNCLAKHPNANTSIMLVKETRPRPDRLPMGMQGIVTAGPIKEQQTIVIKSLTMVTLKT